MKLYINFTWLSSVVDLAFLVTAAGVWNTCLTIPASFLQLSEN